MALEFDKTCFEAYKEGINIMVEKGKALCDENAAVMTYRNEKKRLETSSFLKAEVSTAIDEILAVVADDEDYNRLLSEFTDTVQAEDRFDAKKGDAFRQKAAHLTKNYLNSLHVKIPEPSPEMIPQLFEFNSKIETDKQKYLLAGSFCLFYFRYAQRKAIEKKLAQKTEQKRN